MATALYRRYRPETFADVIGQEHVTEPLMQALRTGRVNHAYLFSGPRGCGKTTSARILARCLNCEQGPTPEPCGTCPSCLALARGGAGSVDVIEIDAASHGGVDDARDLRERASYGPAQSRYKIYIIDEAHMVTTQGFNALLKIVEEPPEHVKFVFATTEPEKVIGTIRSRTHHYPFRLVPPAKLTAYMERLLEQEAVSVQPGVLSFVTRAGGGSVRDSLSVLDQLIAGSGPEGLTYDGAVSLLGFTDGELLDATVEALAAGDGAATFRQIDKVIESGHDPRRFVEDLLERLRDLIIVAAVQEGAAQVLRGVPEDQLERMRVQQTAFGPGALSRAADIVNTGLTEMTGATAPRLQLELICARILLPASSGEQGYAARLDRIERRLDVGGVPTGAPGAAQPGRAAPVAPQARTGSAAPPASTPPAPAQPAPAQPASGQPASGQPASGQAAAAWQPATPGQPAAPEAGRVDAARAAAGSPAVMPPAESVGGPSAVDEQARHRVGTDVDQSRGTARPDAAPAAPGAPGPAHQGGEPPARSTSPGGLDTAAIRRAWPDVLGRIFTMRRLTWTFVSQNAQVTDFDGTTLTLGIATAGLTTTFRAGNHAEVVRQALIDELGVEAVVNGVHVEEVTQQPAVAPPAGGAASQGEPRTSGAPGPAGGTGTPAPPEASSSAGGGPDARADAGGATAAGVDPARGFSWGDAGAGHSAGSTSDPSARAPRGAGRGSAPGGPAAGLADAGLSPVSAVGGRSLEENAGWGSVTGPAPDWATGPVPEAPRAGASTTATGQAAGEAAGGPAQAGASGVATATALRGASAVRASFAQARSAPGKPAGGQPTAPLTDDSAVSDDDEDIEASGDVGRSVIERVLGGRVVQELEE